MDDDNKDIGVAEPEEEKGPEVKEGEDSAE